MAERTSVVILNWNGEEFLRRFLPSVIRYSTGCDIVVADNGSSDGSLALLESSFSEVRVVKLDKNYGFAEGYNRAIEQVDSEIIVLLNSDVLVSEDWIAPLITFLDKNQEVAAVMPKILSESRPDEFEHAGAAGGYIDLWGFPFCRGRIGSTVERDSGQYDEPAKIFWASGAALVIRREAYIKAGGLDGHFFAHMEEIDLAWRLQSLGWQLAVVPESKVWHVGGGALPYESPRKLFLNFRNSLYMLFKNLPTRLLIPILFTRMSIDGFIAMGYLLTGKVRKFRAIISAHLIFYRMLPWLKDSRRKQLQSMPAAIYRGSILARYLFVSKRFDQLF